MSCFYVLPETNVKLYQNSPKRIVFLAGGYDGYYFNFGDLLQLKGAINWHKKENPDAFILPIIHLAPVPNKTFIKELSAYLGTSDFLFYAFPEEISRKDFKEKIVQLSFEPMRLFSKEPSLIFHVYGGGFFNRFWGEFKLKEIEMVLDNFPIDYYVISGQQIEREFIPALVEHIRKYQPDIIGCRDFHSLEILSEQGIISYFSSDDSFGELSYIARKAKNLKVLGEYKFSFALNMNLSYYVLSSDEVFLNKLDYLLNLLSSKGQKDGIPIFVESYLTRNNEVQNMWVSIKKSLLTKYFPKFIGIDLAGYLLKGELQEAGSILRLAPFLIANSYHTALFGKMLGISTYLMSFNEYYAQKQSGLEVKQRTLEEFLDEAKDIILKEQEEVIKTHEEARTKWLKELKEVLGIESKRVHFRVLNYYKNKVDYYKEKLKGLNTQLESLQAEVGRLKDENLQLRNHNVILTEEIFHLKKRLSFIEKSISWHLVETWWKVKAHPIGRIVFFPIVKLVHFIWRRK